MPKLQSFCLHFGLKYLFSYLFNIYIIILVFDPMRESLDLGAVGSLVTGIRELLIFILLFIVCFVKKNKKHSLFLIGFLCCLTVSVILSLFSTLGLSNNIKGFYGFLRGICVCFVILNLDDLYIYDITFLTKYYVKIITVSFIFSAFIWFSHPELLLEKYFTNRLSVGNPSMQSIIYITGFSLVFFYEPFKKNLITFIFEIILFLATMSTVTSTAFVGIGCIFILSIFNGKLFLKWIPIVFIFAIVCVLVIIFSNFDFDWMLTTVNYKIEELFQLAEKFFSADSKIETQSASFSAREVQIMRFKNNCTFFNLFFGDGNWAMSDMKNLMIENTYYGVIRDFGLFGGVVYYLGLVFCILKGIIDFFYHKNFGFLVFSALLASYSTTLYLLAGTSMIVQFYLYYYIIKNRSNLLKVRLK